MMFERFTDTLLSEVPCHTSVPKSNAGVAVHYKVQVGTC